MFKRSANQVAIKSPEDLEAMRRAGRLAAQALELVLGEVHPGVTTQHLDDVVAAFAKRKGAVCAPLNYKGFPKGICTSVNQVVCHGIPSPEHILAEGDIVGVDVTLILDGFHGDTAATVPVGQVSDEARRIIDASLRALQLGVAAVRSGGRLGEVGYAIEQYAKPLGLGVVRQFVGHGLGRRFHEPPQVPHYGRRTGGPVLRPGMTFTIEPMINLGTWRARILRDGWTAVTRDGRLSSQFEHTIAVTPDGAEVLTRQRPGPEWESPGQFEWPQAANRGADPQVGPSSGAVQG